MKILYDLKVTTTDEKLHGQRVVRVTATVRRLRVDSAIAQIPVRIVPVDEPASQVTRMISCQALEMCHDSKGLVKMETDAATDEAMRVAVRRGPHEDPALGQVRARDEYRKKVAAAGPGWWRSNPDVPSFEDMEKQFAAANGIPSHMLGATTSGKAVKTGLQRCPVCLRPDSAKPGSPCPVCLKTCVVKPDLSAAAAPGVGCPVCGKSDEWVQLDGGPCQRCSSVGRCAAMDRAATAVDREPCPECGGTGEVQLFTSVQPCSRGCKK